MVCGRCGSSCSFPADAAGATETCPHCHAHVDVPSGSDSPFGDRALDEAPEGTAEDGSIVLLCPFCDEHARFDASASGTTQACPHCGEELDVLGSLVGETEPAATVYFRCDWCKRLARTDEAGLEHGCVCPHCHEQNDPDQVTGGRLTTGQAERLGLFQDPGQAD
jgi:hypothetical protein